MLDHLHQEGRHLVTIIDPHLKVDPEYFVYKDALQRGLLVQNETGQAYEGKCWPQLSSWIDFINPKSLDLLIDLYCPNEEIVKNLDKNYIWND